MVGLHGAPCQDRRPWGCVVEQSNLLERRRQAGPLRLVQIAGVALLLAACSGDDNSTTGLTTGTSTTDPTGTSTGTGSETDTTTTGGTESDSGMTEATSEATTESMTTTTTTGESESATEPTGATTAVDPVCGDGVVDDGEACDDGLNDGAYGGCAPDCSALAAYCGDGNVDGDDGEVCDDGVNDGAYDGCNADCLSLAAFCGDGSVDEGEACDGDDLGGKTCESEDFDGGEISCGACALNTESCFKLDGASQENAGLSCKQINDDGYADGDGVYWVDANGGGTDDAVEVFCDMTTDGGGWTALAANGEIAAPETTSADDCYPLISDDGDAGCGAPDDLLSDFTVDGSQQAGIAWQHLMAIAYSDQGYGEKLAYFAIDFGDAAATTEERIGGTAFVPPGLNTMHGKIACAGAGDIIHYTKAGTYNSSASYIANGKGTIFGHSSANNMTTSSRRTFGFTDRRHTPPGQTGVGIDDYQDGWSCSDNWAPSEVKGGRMVVLVR